jgi:hypothetical protein
MTLVSLSALGQKKQVSSYLSIIQVGTWTVLHALHSNASKPLGIAGDPAKVMIVISLPPHFKHFSIVKGVISTAQPPLFFQIISIIFVRAVLPPTIFNELFGRCKKSANTLISIELASLSTGGAVSRTLYSPSEIFTTSFLEDRGLTLT